ncbi:MAG: iron-containing alcohol dehydrogenase [Rhodospirillales bacterium]|jgi:hydroxyacid-oxoacid transhydrogenase|nr:iron-containing alcohol dehydrogenase [Rhodospirillales bacterium]
MTDFYTPGEGGETVFTVGSSNMKFGVGALGELGEDAAALGMTRVAFFTDRTVGATECAAVALASLGKAGMDVAIFDECRVEPTDTSMTAAARFARDGGFDGTVSFGGGSVMDTAKAANLLASHPGDLLTYCHAPHGQAVAVPGPLKPHIACPTTSGTGAEVTAISVFSLTGRNVKTAIRSNHIKPTMAVVDPLVTETLPANVVAFTGFDVLTHALESYTARPFTRSERAPSAARRSPYQGANPWGDMGSLEAIRLGGEFLVRAVNGPDDREARQNILFAATLAGLAFGNVGVHIPHAASYGVSSLNHDYVAAGYETVDPMIPHGLSVVLNAPAAIRFTAPAEPHRHLSAAAALGADVQGAAPEDAGEILAGRLIELMKNSGIPNGLGGVGYTKEHIPDLAAVTGALKRQLSMSPRPVAEMDLREIFTDALCYW